MIPNMDRAMWMGLEDRQLFQPMLCFVESGQNFVVVVVVVLAAVVLAAVVAVTVVAPKSRLTISHHLF